MNIRKETDNHIQSSEFNFYNLDDYFEVSKINPNVKYKKRVIGDFEIIIADDFLLYPEQYRDFLKKFPGFSNSKRRQLSRPGYSQKFHPEMFRRFEHKISDFLHRPIEHSVWASNIMHSHMKTYKPSWVPHYDSKVGYVMNYWMCEGVGETGICFYEFKGRKKMDYGGSKFDQQYTQNINKHSLDYVMDMQWKNFDHKSDEDWNLYYVSKVKFNRVVFYDPYLFHGPYIEPDSYLNHYRYSLVGFMFTDESVNR